MKKFKLIIASLAVLFCMVPAAPVLADEFDPFEGVCNADSAKNSTACNTDGSNPLTGKDGILYKVSQILALVAAIAAVIVIIIGGLMYALAGGDSGKINTAKSAIVTAVVGLIVIAVAEVLIALVINLVD